MTGYARINSSVGEHDFVIEMKSVNSRNQDIRLRLGSNLDVLEQKLRKKITSFISRGSINISISLNLNDAKSEIVINEQALKTVLNAMQNISKQVKTKKPSPEGILALKGVLEQRDALVDEKSQAAVLAAVTKNFDICLNDLVTSRQLEGAKLQKILLRRIDEIESLSKKAQDHPSRNKKEILHKLKLQISELLDASPSLSEERLNQEAMILATKADICEEIDRLLAHVKAARELLNNGGVIGRKFDFLSQEFNREANTLCAKSNSVGLTAIGLDLKLVIDQLREQVQNIE